MIYITFLEHTFPILYIQWNCWKKFAQIMTQYFISQSGKTENTFCVKGFFARCMWMGHSVQISDMSFSCIHKIHHCHSTKAYSIKTMFRKIPTVSMRKKRDYKSKHVLVLMHSWNTHTQCIITLPLYPIVPQRLPHLAFISPLPDSIICVIYSFRSKNLFAI